MKLERRGQRKVYRKYIEWWFKKKEEGIALKSKKMDTQELCQIKVT